MEKHKENFNKKKVLIITLISFIFGFSQAVAAYVLSTFFEISWGMKSVGFFYFGTYLISLFLILNLHKFVSKLGKSSSFALFSALEIFILCGLVSWGLGKTSAFLVVLYLVFAIALWVTMDIILESFSSDEVSGEIRGRYLTVFNLGFLFGPFISTGLLDKFGYSGIFSFVLFANILILIVFVTFVRKIDSKIIKREKIKDIFKRAWKRKNIMRIYYISFILEAFFALMVIYTPIYLREMMGFSWPEIGRIFTVMLIPFVLLQFPAGFLADRKWGEKEMLIFGILLMSASTSYIYFATSGGVLFWSLTLFATRIGAAIVEVLRDSYFYKQVDGKDVDLIDFFRTASSIGHIFSTLLAALLLIFFPLKLAFLLIAIFVLTSLIPAFNLKDSK